MNENEMNGICKKNSRKRETSQILLPCQKNQKGIKVKREEKRQISIKTYLDKISVLVLLSLMVINPQENHVTSE